MLLDQQEEGGRIKVQKNGNVERMITIGYLSKLHLKIDSLNVFFMTGSFLVIDINYM